MKKALNKLTAPKSVMPEKISQFGEGNFLRTFVDLYFDTLNKEGKEYKVSVHLTGFFNLAAKEENEPYFIGTTYGKITGMKLPYCDLTELDRQEFEYYCTVIKKIGKII